MRTEDKELFATIAIVFLLALLSLYAHITDKPQPQYYIEYQIQPGDSLSKIAEKYSSNTKEIMQSNGIKYQNNITAGSKLLIPVSEIKD